MNSLIRQCAQLKGSVGRPWVLAVVLGSLLVLAGCATVYTTEDFSAYQAAHETAAILPYAVDITLKQLPEGISEDDIPQMEREEGYTFQKVLYTQFLSRSQKDDYTIEFQDVDRTNALLSRAGIDYDNINAYTKEEIATALGVDALISGRISRSKPMGTGGAIASLIFLGFSQTNQVHVNMSIHCGTSGDLVWSYDHEVSGGLGSTPEGVAKSLMKDVAKKFPYRRAS